MFTLAVAVLASLTHQYLSRVESVAKIIPKFCWTCHGFILLYFKLGWYQNI